ncbi:DUF3311 domain-containing protein [Streptomyces armeniacus]|uniref:DUF3311 domain-containing protein n=1 Tax=Streptomyces armeniacus TaxID=83291 RepID=A0A345XXM4_9ACTN|nr:DUF3311 domain-containing protein [Streptomyces armeniacus]AXK36390.1 DUF3311 domain-containing protein [Streptomyces armeniacus]
MCAGQVQPRGAGARTAAWRRGARARTAAWLRGTRARTAARLCLAAAFAGPLLAPVSLRTEPRLLGWPFFYWYQLLWVPLAAVLLACAGLLRRRARTAGAAAAAPPRPDASPARGPG